MKGLKRLYIEIIHCISIINLKKEIDFHNKPIPKLKIGKSCVNKNPLKKSINTKQNKAPETEFRIEDIDQGEEELELLQLPRVQT